jgi:hypothetical protein
VDKEILFRIFSEGYLMGTKNKEFADLSQSELNQRIRNRFDSLMEELD